VLAGNIAVAPPFNGYGTREKEPEPGSPATRGRRPGTGRFAGQLQGLYQNFAGKTSPAAFQ
jgi:hypothetical protein